MGKRGFILGSESYHLVLGFLFFSRVWEVPHFGTWGIPLVLGFLLLLHHLTGSTLDFFCLFRFRVLVSIPLSQLLCLGRKVSGFSLWVFGSSFSKIGLERFFIFMTVGVMIRFQALPSSSSCESSVRFGIFYNGNSSTFWWRHSVVWSPVLDGECFVWLLVREGRAKWHVNTSPSSGRDQRWTSHLGGPLDSPSPLTHLESFDWGLAFGISPKVSWTINGLFLPLHCSNGR